MSKVNTQSPPRWKSLLSYLRSLPLEHAQTPHNPDLQLHLHRGRYLLSTPNAIYSYGDLYLNFLETFRRIDLDRLGIESVLLPGFGLGSIPWMLEKHFRKKYHYTGVEIDEVVAGWAMRYVLPKLTAPVTLYTADAFHFVKLCAERFDLIAVDIFLDELVPEQFDEPEFTERLAQLLTGNGLLLWNRLNDRPRFRERNREFAEKVFRKFFPNAFTLNLGANQLLVSHPEALLPGFQPKR